MTQSLTDQELLLRQVQSYVGRPVTVANWRGHGRKRWLGVNIGRLTAVQVEQGRGVILTVRDVNTTMGTFARSEIGVASVEWIRSYNRRTDHDLSGMELLSAQAPNGPLRYFRADTKEEVQP